MSEWRRSGPSRQIVDATDGVHVRYYYHPNLFVHIMVVFTFVVLMGQKHGQRGVQARSAWGPSTASSILSAVNTWGPSTGSVGSEHGRLNRRA